jgi:hypothetical protein
MSNKIFKKKIDGICFSVKLRFRAWNESVKVTIRFISELDYVQVSETKTFANKEAAACYFSDFGKKEANEAYEYAVTLFGPTPAIQA